MRALLVAAVVTALVPLVGCSSAAPLPRKALELNHAGAVAFAHGDLELAYARIALALEYNPRFTEAWVNLGLVEQQRGHLDLAKRDYVKARDLNPDLPSPHHALGVLAETTGHTEEAERDYRVALKVDPGFAPARINLARLLFARGDFEQAREHFLRLTQVASESIDGWTGLFDSLLRLHRTADAEALLVRAHEAFGEVPSIQLLEARVLMHHGAFAEAEARLEPLASGTDRQHASEALAWIAVARLGRGDSDGARRAAERASSLDPTDPVARYALETARAPGH
jgi:Flp pilus assembly protein TadD